MRFPISFFSALLLLSACTESPTDKSTTTEVATWTVEEDLRIDEEEDYYLGSVANLAVRSDGALLVADREEHHIKVISPEGELLRTIGREGEGPGEFQSLRQVSLARGDSLYVLDGTRRLLVFTPESYTQARTIQLPGSPEGRMNPVGVMVPPQEGFLVFYLDSPALGGAADPVLFRVGENGEQLGRVNIPQQTSERVDIVANKTVSKIDVPFDRRSVVALGPEGRLYHGINDSLALTISNLSGEVLNHWSLQAEPRPLTDDDLRIYGEAYADQAAVTFGESIREATIGAVDEALGEADLPDTRPDFHDLLVDNQQRVWIRRDPKHVETTTWWITSVNGEGLAELTLPGNVQLEAAHGQYAYGVIRGGKMVPTVIRYSIKEAV